MKKSGKNKKPEQPQFHYLPRSFRLADETWEALRASYKASGKKSWNLFFVEVNKKLKNDNG